MIRITLTSVLVDDQEKAARFYTDVLGFAPKLDLPLGDARWLTVVSPADPDGTQLLLEPANNDVGRTIQSLLREAAIPATTFEVDDVRAEYERLASLGVTFTTEPVDIGTATIAVLDDTCGNLIGLHRPH